jgi:hypothetical protein
MQLKPITQRAARAFVDQHHRHHKAPRGDVFRIGLEDNDQIVGVIMVGRPVARHLQDGYTLEINRTCILDGYKNACSMLLGAAARAGKALGYHRIITYTLCIEPGTSLRAAGFIEDSKVKKSLWNRPSREREQKSLFQEYDKTRWIRILRSNNAKI